VEQQHQQQCYSSSSTRLKVPIRQQRRHQMLLKGHASGNCSTNSSDLHLHCSTRPPTTCQRAAACQCVLPPPPAVWRTWCRPIIMQFVLLCGLVLTDTLLCGCRYTLLLCVCALFAIMQIGHIPIAVFVVVCTGTAGSRVHLAAGALRR
jgi:hypothetical protein